MLSVEFIYKYGYQYAFENEDLDNKEILLEALYELLAPIEEVLAEHLGELDDVLEYFEMLGAPKILLRAIEDYFNLYQHEYELLEGILISLVRLIMLILKDNYGENTVINEFTILHIIGNFDLY